jgi:hypothetical protein
MSLLSFVRDLFRSTIHCSGNVQIAACQTECRIHRGESIFAWNEISPEEHPEPATAPATDTTADSGADANTDTASS